MIDNEELAGEGIGSGVEKEQENHQDPFDPTSISITSKVVSLESVLRRIKNNTINLNPDFQRKVVWDQARKSRLIESMMLRIPLPMFYVAEDYEGSWEVVDGLQRLSSIREFLLGKDYDGKGFKLKGLEFWGDLYDGHDFFNLQKITGSSMMVNHIMETELSFTIIKPDTPEKVKRNVFKRINTGGMKLSEQEIRNALYQGRSTRILSTLVATADYINSLGRTVHDDRMAGRELILRFFAFKILKIRNYKGDMDDYLSIAMESINKGFYTVDDVNQEIPSDETLKAMFITGIQRAYQLFGDHAFRKSFKNRKKTPINKSLFDTWMCFLSTLHNDIYQRLLDDKKVWSERYYEILTDSDFDNAISRYSSDISSVKYRYRTIREIIKAYK
ncbi:DUF262 domain-containing protein [Aeromonas veronii]